MENEETSRKVIHTYRCLLRSYESYFRRKFRISIHQKMVGIIGEIIIGEAGDVLVPRQFYEIQVPYIPSEVVQWNPEGMDGNTPYREYHRLIGLPPIRQINRHFHPFIGLTTEGTLIVISERFPQGLHLDLDDEHSGEGSFPFIKELIKVFPLGLLDIHNTLHFLDIGGIIMRQSNNLIDAGVLSWQDQGVRAPVALNVRGISYGIESNGNSMRGYEPDLVMILTDDNRLLHGLAEDIARGDPIVTELEDLAERLVGRAVIYQSGDIEIYNLNQHLIKSVLRYGNRHQIQDVIIPSNTSAYIIDSEDKIRSYGNEDLGMIIETPFIPIRLILGTGMTPLIEDDGGNIYSIRTLQPQNYPIVMMNPDVTRRHRGMTVKAARKFPPFAPS